MRQWMMPPSPESAKRSPAGMTIRRISTGIGERWASIWITPARADALHLTDPTMNFAENKARAGELLDLIDAALDAGADITLDTYPYLPGATTLSAILPSWSSSGGTEATLARLADPET